MLLELINQQHGRFRLPRRILELLRSAGLDQPLPMILRLLSPADDPGAAERIEGAQRRLGSTDQPLQREVDTDGRTWSAGIALELATHGLLDELCRLGEHRGQSIKAARDVPALGQLCQSLSLGLIINILGQLGGMEKRLEPCVLNGEDLLRTQAGIQQRQKGTDRIRVQLAGQ